MEEIWKPVVGAEGYYEVSNLGRIKSLERIDMRGNKLPERMIKFGRSKNGYLFFCCCINKKRKNIRIHRCVAEAFIPNPLCLNEVNHINGDKTNNEVKNLEWCSRSENIRHAYKTGLNSKIKSVIQYDLNMIYIRFYDSIHQASRETGINSTNIAAVARGRRKTTGGYIWRYADDKQEAA